MFRKLFAGSGSSRIGLAPYKPVGPWKTMPAPAPVVRAAPAAPAWHAGENEDWDMLGSNAPDAIGLGRYCDWHTGDIGPRLRFGGDEGVMLVGRNGSGKDTRILMPLLLQSTGMSAFVIDVKGELAAVTAPFRRRLGPVVIINPYGVLTDIPGYEDLRSDGLNPLLPLDPDAPSFPADCGFLADSVIVSGKQDSGNAQHFIESANALTALSIMWEVVSARAERRIPLWSRVRELICTDSGYDPRLKAFFGWPALARQILRTGRPALCNLASQFLTWSSEKDSIASDAMRQTKAFDDTEVASDLARGSFDLRALKRQPVTVYLILPPDVMERQSRYLRLLVDSALRAVMRARRPGEPKCLFLLNEMATLGELKTLTQVWGVVRGFGIQLMPVLQSYSQLTGIYGSDAATTFTGQAGVVASFGASDMPTAKWLSERCGDTTAVLAGYNQGTQQNQGGMGASSGLSWSQVRVPTVTPHETFNLRDGRMIQFGAGLGDFVSAYAPPYWMIDECTARARANPYYHQPAPRALPHGRPMRELTWEDQ